MVFSLKKKQVIDTQNQLPIKCCPVPTKPYQILQENNLLKRHPVFK